MKKNLSIAAIVVLVIALAITSTVAIYSSTVNVGGDGANTITAKKFYIGSKHGEQSFVDAEIAPAETVDWDFTVTNQRDENYVAAVDMDMMVNVAITTDIHNLTVELIQVNAENREEVVKSFNKNNLSDTYRPAQPAFIAKQAKTYKFIIRINWPAGNENDTDTDNGVNQDKATILVTVKGAQSI